MALPTRWPIGIGQHRNPPIEKISTTQITRDISATAERKINI